MDSIIYNKLPDNLKAKFTFLVNGNKYWIARFDALELVGWLLDNDYKVFGFEGFTFGSSGITPNMECIVDLSINSNVSSVKRGIEFAILQTVDFIDIAIAPKN